jgi:RecB family endonuclease NucS
MPMMMQGSYSSFLLLLSGAAGAEDWILMGHEATAPHWMPAHAQCVSYNFTTTTSETETKRPSADLLKKLQNVQQIVVGIRPPLVTSSIVNCLDIFLRAVMDSCSQVDTILVTWRLSTWCRRTIRQGIVFAVSTC